ncbi:hypothetical protein RRG08_062355 [Elysia crispata]|uniref:Uncharacterized protein n=1 Tax=Elysia crispata TaxID=231223 RepID=A0AAE0YHZ8_9GAST|nr:hypothetical protein RRG08_062355 [Elysia crispata]
MPGALSVLGALELSDRLHRRVCWSLEYQNMMDNIRVKPSNRNIHADSPLSHRELSEDVEFTVFDRGEGKSRVSTSDPG